MNRRFLLIKLPLMLLLVLLPPLYYRCTRHITIHVPGPGEGNTVQIRGMDYTVEEVEQFLHARRSTIRHIHIEFHSKAADEKDEKLTDVIAAFAKEQGITCGSSSPSSGFGEYYFSQDQR